MSQTKSSARNEECLALEDILILVSAISLIAFNLLIFYLINYKFIKLGGLGPD